MPLLLLLGGARSGKSRLAVSLARDQAGPVTVLVTAEARDAEMAERIAAHRAERPARWETIEEPLRLEAAIAAVPDEQTLLLDCLSLWVANLLERGDRPEAVAAAAERAAALAATRSGLTVAVSNEVGLGVVPATPLGRLYRDVLGTANRAWAQAATQAVFVVAGRLLPLQAVDAIVLPATRTP
jgi:adenosylcobinamide kinase / adenosylcobinamide-phosphate guanylyltransferase